MVKERKSKAVVVEAEDRISNLPDNILHHILSFVRTKEAVRTCVLSTRWKYIWMGIPTLDFHEEYDVNPNCRTDFLKYVQEVLCLHDGSVINMFQLVTCEDYNYDSHDSDSRIEALVSMILSRKIQQLDLWIGSPILYPPSLFSCDSFTVLKLSGVDCSFRLPASVCFPCLKIMHLGSITFASDQTIQQVSFSCPVLEDLKFLFCLTLVRSIHIFVPELKRLKIEDFEDMPRSFTNEIKMHAKCLDFFHVINNLPCAFSFCNLLSLKSATIDIDRSDLAGDLVQVIQNVKELKLSFNTVEYLFTSRKDLLALSNLKKLTLHLISLSSELFTKLLYSVPQIHSLIIAVADNHPFEGYDFTVIEIPKSFLSHLKLFEIRFFRGEESEFSLVEMLLKNVRTIEKMIIVPSYDLAGDLKKQNEVMRRLLLLPRASSCVIDFSLLLKKRQ